MRKFRFGRDVVSYTTGSSPLRVCGPGLGLGLSLGGGGLRGLGGGLRGLGLRRSLSGSGGLGLSLVLVGPLVGLGGFAVGPVLLERRLAAGPPVLLVGPGPLGLLRLVLLELELLVQRLGERRQLLLPL